MFTPLCFSHCGFYVKLAVVFPILETVVLLVIVVPCKINSIFFYFRDLCAFSYLGFYVKLVAVFYILETVVLLVVVVFM